MSEQSHSLDPDGAHIAALHAGDGAALSAAIAAWPPDRLLRPDRVSCRLRMALRHGRADLILPYAEAGFAGLAPLGEDLVEAAMSTPDGALARSMLAAGPATRDLFFRDLPHWLTLGREAPVRALLADLDPDERHRELLAAVLAEPRAAGLLLATGARPRHWSDSDWDLVSGTRDLFADLPRTDALYALVLSMRTGHSALEAESRVPTLDSFFSSKTMLPPL